MRRLHTLAAVLLLAAVAATLFGVRMAYAESQETDDLPSTFTLRLSVPTSGLLPATVAAEAPQPVSSNGRTRVYPGDPYQRNIAYLDIADSKGNLSFCTGTVLGPGVILTAAHCAVGLPGGPAVKSIRVVPGMNGSAAPFGSEYATSSVVPAEWESLPLSQAVAFDYGLVFLPDTLLTAQVGAFPGSLPVLPEEVLRAANLDAVMIGYPADCNESRCLDQNTNGDAPFGVYPWEGRASTVTSVDANFLYDTIASWHGESGAPIIRTSDGAIIGIHSRGMTGSNADIRMTGQVVAWLSRTCAGHAGCSFAFSQPAVSRAAR